MSLNIEIRTIPHKTQRYPTVGDYWWEGTKLIIRVSDMQNWKYELLVAFHELIESELCFNRNIPEEAITAFDLQFEDLREDGNTDEPGDNKSAPYYHEHQFATHCEREFADELDVTWKDYDKKVREL